MNSSFEDPALVAKYKKLTDSLDNILKFYPRLPHEQVEIKQQILGLFKSELNILLERLPKKYPNPDERYLGNVPDELINWEALTAQRAFNFAIDQVTIILKQELEQTNAKYQDPLAGHKPKKIDANNGLDKELHKIIARHDGLHGITHNIMDGKMLSKEHCGNCRETAKSLMELYHAQSKKDCIEARIDELGNFPKSEIGKLANYGLKADIHIQDRIATLKNNTNGMEGL